MDARWLTVHSELKTRAAKKNEMIRNARVRALGRGLDGMGNLRSSVALLGNREMAVRGLEFQKRAHQVYGDTVGRVLK